MMEAWALIGCLLIGGVWVALQVLNLLLEAKRRSELRRAERENSQPREWSRPSTGVGNGHGIYAIGNGTGYGVNAVGGKT
jgi:hypothetical protein